MYDPCAALQLWLHRMAGAPDEAAPPVDLIAHIAGCPRCKGTLLLFVAERGEIARPPDAHSCASAEEQLPMFVDYERANGAVAAAQTFPAIWWATVVCPRCSAAYAEIQELAAAPGEPWQPNVPAQTSRQRMQLRVRGDAVARMLGAGRQLGVAWGEHHSDLMISEEEHDEYRIQIFLRRKQAGWLTLVVRTEPPARGIASLMIAHKVLYLQLDPDGHAVFTNLAESLFDADNDLIVTLDTLG